jgi:hypothetical protein
MADRRLPQYQQYLAGEKAGDPKAIETLTDLRQRAPALIQRLDAELAGGGQPAPTPAAPAAAPPAPEAPPLTIPPPPAPGSTGPPPTGAQDANVLPPGLGQPQSSDVNVLPPGFSGGQGDPGVGGAMGRVARTLGRAALRMAGGPPRPPELDVQRGLENRMASSYEANKQFMGVGSPPVPPSPTAVEENQAVRRLGGPSLQGDQAGFSLYEPAQKALAGAMTGTQVPKQLLQAYVESTLGQPGPGGQPNPQAPQIADALGTGIDAAQLVAGIDTLARTAYNAWPRGVGGQLRRWDAARRAYDELLATRSANIETAQRGYETAQNARTVEITSRKLQRLRDIRSARQAAVPATDEAIAGARSTLEQAQRDFAQSVSNLPPNLSRRSYALQSAAEPRGQYGGPPSLRTLRRARARGSPGGSLRMGDVPPDLSAARNQQFALGGALSDAEQAINAAEQTTNPAQAQEHLRRAYQSIREEFPHLGQDQSWHDLGQAIDAIETARQPITTPPVTPRPVTPPRPQRPQELMSRRPTRPTYGQTRNRVIGRVAKAGLYGGAGLGGITYLFRNQLAKLFNEENMQRQGLEPQTPPHMQLQP